MTATAAPRIAEEVAPRLRAARVAARVLARSAAEERNRALASVAAALERDADVIAAANADDLADAGRAVARGELAAPLLQRLALDAAKVRGLAGAVRQMAVLDDPIGRRTLHRELDDGLVLERVTCPIGVVGVIFESRPDALVQIAALAIKSGNGAVLKGGREARRSNRALFDTIRKAVDDTGLPGGALVLLEDRTDVAALLDADGDVDLIIPRGSNSLVRWVQDHTRIPVLGHAEGVCHLYIDRSADPAKAVAVAVDSKVQYPAACNAVETILVHAEAAPRLLARLTEALRAEGVEVRAGEDPEDWGIEFGDLTVAVRVVGSLDEAVAHINRHGSRHTDAIVTEDESARDRFFADVDAAGVFWNASTRFADGFRYGFGAEVGISTGRLAPRGPVGLDGLVTYKYRLLGDGHVVASYSGPGARAFTHRDL